MFKKGEYKIWGDMKITSTIPTKSEPAAKSKTVVFQPAVDR